MMNLSMKKCLETGEALNLRKIGKEVSPGTFELAPGTFREGADYADPETERWAWSIGKRKSDGVVFASTDATCIYYQNPEYECLWLR